MLKRQICLLLGNVCFALSLAMLAPLLIAGYFEFIAPETHPQPHCTLSFLVAVLTTLICGGVLYSLGRELDGQFYAREGILSVVLIWLLAPALSCLPFIFSETLQNPVQAYFEALSGLTTTGASVITAKNYDVRTGKEIPLQAVICGPRMTSYIYEGNIDPIRDPKTGRIIYEGVEAVGKGLLFWRSELQWLGGLGIILLFIAILPALGAGGKVLLQSEAGPMKESLTPRIQETASLLWKIYLGLTLFGFVLVWGTNRELTWFDTVTLTFSTISGGGFSTQNASLASFSNSYTEWVILLLMFLGSVNFSLYFFALKGKFFRLKDPELIAYVCIILFASIFTTYQLMGTPNKLVNGETKGLFDFWTAFRQSLFHSVSVESSTGFAIGNYDLWPYSVQTLTLVLMFIGGMSGSTAGGMKVIRPLILFHVAKNKIESLFRPSAIRAVRIGNTEIDRGVILTVLCFFLIHVTVAVGGIFAYTLDGVDGLTAVGLTTSMINNVGVAFGAAGPTETVGFLSDSGLVLSCFLMLLGRLEFFSVLVLLVPAFWKE